MTGETPKLTADAAARVARKRSIAIALMLGGMVVLFYATTLVRFGGAIAPKGVPGQTAAPAQAAPATAAPQPAAPVQGGGK